MSGWFAMKRGIHDHPLFHKQPERLFVWSWILATAAWKDTRQDANGQTVTVKRGQLLTSYRQMSNATGVGIQVIRTLIDRLQTEAAIDTDTNTGRILITVCNYDKYQSRQEDDNTPANTRATQDQHTKGTSIQKKEAKASSTPKRKSRLTEDAVISDGQVTAATERGLSLREAEAQFQRFKNDAIAKGKSFVNWDRAFVTWLDSPYFKPITTIEGSGHGSSARNADRLQHLITAAAAGSSGKDWG